MTLPVKERFETYLCVSLYLLNLDARCIATHFDAKPLEIRHAPESELLSFQKAVKHCEMMVRIV